MNDNDTLYYAEWIDADVNSLEYAKKVFTMGAAYGTVAEDLCKRYAIMFIPLVRDILFKAGAIREKDAMPLATLRGALEAWSAEYEAKTENVFTWPHGSVFSPSNMPVAVKDIRQALEECARSHEEDLDALIYAVYENWPTSKDGMKSLRWEWNITEDGQIDDTLWLLEAY